MRSSLRSAAVAGRPAALALLCCLLAPPLAHDHGGQRTPRSAVADRPCEAGDASAHLHGAAIRPAPPCPACAAGPTSVATAGGHEVGTAHLLGRAPSPEVSTPPGSATVPVRRSRAPPRRPSA